MSIILLSMRAGFIMSLDGTSQDWETASASWHSYGGYAQKKVFACEGEAFGLGGSFLGHFCSCSFLSFFSFLEVVLHGQKPDTSCHRGRVSGSIFSVLPVSASFLASVCSYSPMFFVVISASSDSSGAVPSAVLLILSGWSGCVGRPRFVPRVGNRDRRHLRSSAVNISRQHGLHTLLEGKFKNSPNLNSA
jgi:hypothetical protein